MVAIAAINNWLNGLGITPFDQLNPWVPDTNPLTGLNVQITGLNVNNMNDDNRNIHIYGILGVVISLLIGLTYWYNNKPTVHVQTPTGNLEIEQSATITQPTNSNARYLPETHPCDTDYTWPGVETGGSYRSR